MNERSLTHRQLFGETPGEFTLRVNGTLKELKEEKPMKKSIGGIILAAALLLALCAAALAAATGGLDWFYKDLFYTRPLPENVSELIQNDPPQTCEDRLLNMTVQSAVWLPKDYDGNNPGQRSLEILVSAVPKDPGAYEAHVLENLNVDEARSGRQEDYLQTQKGFGPIPQVMDDAAKNLLLVDDLWDDRTLTLTDAPNAYIPISFYHQFDGEDQNVVSYISFHVGDSLLKQIKACADTQGNVSFTYTGYSWVWSATGKARIEEQKGTVAFTIKLPE